MMYDWTETGRRRSKAGFTLLELLVVIAVIAILAGLMQSMFGKVIDKARQISCASNQKQLGMAFGIYAGDYSNRLPACATRAGNKQHTWNWAWALYNWEYARDTGVFICPAAREYKYAVQMLETPSPTWLSYTTYGYNEFIGSFGGDYADDFPCAPLNIFEHPSSTVVLADSMTYHTDGMPMGAYRLSLPSANPVWRIDDRHAGGANILWADWHVSFQRDAVNTMQYDADDFYFYWLKNDNKGW